MADFYTKEEINSFIEDPKKYHNITDSGKEVKLCIGMNNIYKNSENDLGDPSDCWYYGLINIVNIYMGKNKLDNIINAYNSNYKKPDGESVSKILDAEELKNIYNNPSIYHNGTVNAIELTQSLRLEYGKSKTAEESSKEALKFVSTVYRRGPENCINNRDKKFLNLKRVNKAMGLAFNKQFIEFSNIKNFSYGGKISEEEFMASLFLYYNSSSSKVDYKELYKVVVKENSTYESLENIKKLYKEYYGLPLLNVDYSVEEYEKSSLTNADTLLSELTKLMFNVSDPESSKKVAGYFVDNKYHISKSIETNYDSIYNSNPKLKTLLSYNYGDVPTWREESDPGNVPYEGGTETPTEEESSTETNTNESSTETNTNESSTEEERDPAVVPDVVVEEENENIQTVSFDPSDGSDVLENNFISVDRYWNFRNNVTPKVIIEFKVRKKVYDENTKKEVYKYDWWNINDIAGSGQSDNNYFVSMNIEDNGAKRLELVLFDKNFTDIQDILSEAINSVQDSNNDDNVNASEMINIKIQGSDQSWMGKIQEETSFANLRIRFGYSDQNVGVENHNYSGFGLAIKGDTSTTPYYRWRELERNANHYTKEKGEIKTINGVDVADDINIMERFQQSTIMSTSNEFFINGLSTSLTETGVRYTIQGISMESFKLNGYKMMQRYSVLKGKPTSLMAGFKTNFNKMVHIDDSEVKNSLNGSDIFYDYESGKYILVDENKVKEGIERALGPVPFMKKYIGDLVNLKACVVNNPTNTINSYIGGIDNQYGLVKDAEYLLEAEGDKTNITLETSTPIGMMAKTINIILGDSTNEYPSHSYPTLYLEENKDKRTNLKNLAFMANAVKIVSLYGDSYRGFCDLQGLSYDEEVTITYRNFLILQLAILGVGTYNMVSEAGSQFSIDLKQRTESEGIVKTKFDSLNTLFEVNEELPLRWLIHRKSEEEETILDFPREENLAEPAALGENTNFWISGISYGYTSWWGSVGELKNANKEGITERKFKGIKNPTKEYSVYYYPGAGFYDGYVIKNESGKYVRVDCDGNSALFSYGTMESCLNKKNEYDDYIKYPNEADDGWSSIAGEGSAEQKGWAVMSSDMIAYSIARGYFGKLSGDGVFPKLINKLNASEDSGLKEIAKDMDNCNKTFSQSAKEFLNIVTREYIGSSKYPDPIYGTGEKIMKAFINAIEWVQGLFSSTAKQSIGVLGERRDVFKIAYNECVAESSGDEKGLTMKMAKNLFGNKEPAIKNNFIHMKELGEDEGKFLLDECHQTVGVDGIYFQNVDYDNWNNWKFSMTKAVSTKADSFFTYNEGKDQWYSIEITFDPTANEDNTPKGVNFIKPSEFSIEAAFDDFMVFRFYARYKKSAEGTYGSTKYWFMIINLKKEQYNQLISRYSSDLYTPVYIYLNAAALATFVTKNSYWDNVKSYGRFLQFFDRPSVNKYSKAILETVSEGSRLVRGKESDINQKIGIMNTQYQAVLRTFKKVFIKTVNIIQKEIKEVKDELGLNYAELVREISNGDALGNLIKKELSYLNKDKSKFEEKAKPAEYVVDEDKEPFSKYDLYQGYLIENVYKKLTEMSPTDQTSIYKRKQKGEKKADGTPLEPVDTEAVSSVFYYIDLKIEDLQKRIAEREKQAERWRSANVGKEIEISLGNQYSRDTESEEKVDPKNEKIKWKSLASIFNEYCAKCPPLIDAAELAATGLNEKSGENGVIPMVDENGEEITVKAVENFPRYSLTWGIDGEAKSGGVANIKFYYKKPQVPKRIRVYEWGVGNPKQHCIKSLNISSGNEFAMMHKSAFASVDSNNATFISQHYQGNGVEAEVQEVQTVFNEPSLVSGVINGESARSSLLNMRNTIAKGNITLLGDPSLKFYGNFQPFTYPIYVNIILPNRNEVSTFGDTLNKKSSVFQYQLSGYYIISKISHSISSSGFTTTLEVMRYPGSDSGVETHVPKTNHGSDKSGKTFNPAGDLKMINV